MFRVAYRTILNIHGIAPWHHSTHSAWATDVQRYHGRSSLLYLYALAEGDTRGLAEHQLLGSARRCVGHCT